MCPARSAGRPLPLPPPHASPPLGPTPPTCTDTSPAGGLSPPFLPPLPPRRLLCAPLDSRLEARSAPFPYPAPPTHASPP